MSSSEARRTKTQGRPARRHPRLTMVGGHPWACLRARSRFIKAEARLRINRPLKSGKPFTAPECR